MRLSSGSRCGIQLSENPGPSVSPAAAVLTADRSIAVWNDRRNGNPDLYFATYTSAFATSSSSDDDIRYCDDDIPEIVTTISEIVTTISLRL